MEHTNQDGGGNTTIPGAHSAGDFDVNTEKSNRSKDEIPNEKQTAQLDRGNQGW